MFALRTGPANLPVAGDKVYVWKTGTMTEETLYEADGTTPVSQPITVTEGQWGFEPATADLLDIYWDDQTEYLLEGVCLRNANLDSGTTVVNDGITILGTGTTLDPSRVADIFTKKTADSAQDMNGYSILMGGGDIYSCNFYSTLLATFAPPHDFGNSGAAIDIDLSQRTLAKITLTDDSALTFTNVRPGRWSLWIYQSGDNDHAVTLASAATIHMVGKTAYVATTGASAYDVLTIVSDGTTLLIGPALDCGAAA